MPQLPPSCSHIQLGCRSVSPDLPCPGESKVFLAVAKGHGDLLFAVVLGAYSTGLLGDVAIARLYLLVLLFVHLKKHC